MLKETEIIRSLYTARLENGVIIFVYDGYAEGTDGKRYSPVLEADEEGDFEVVGWETAAQTAF